MTDTRNMPRMPAGPPGSGLFTGMHSRMHDAARTDVDRLHTTLSSLHPGEHARLFALASWSSGFVAVIDMHHKVEEAVLLPALIHRVPEDLCDQSLAADHERIGQLLTQISATVDELAGSHAAFDPARRHAIDLVAALDEQLREHHGAEERHLIPLLQQHFTSDERRALDTLALRAIPARTARFTVPWLCSALRHELDAVWPLLPRRWRAVWRMTRRGFARRVDLAFGPARPVAL